jgi:hypothetical protein
LCTLLCCSFPLQSLAFSLLHRALQPLHLWTAQKVKERSANHNQCNNAICCMPQWHLVIIVLHGEKMLEKKLFWRSKICSKYAWYHRQASSAQPSYQIYQLCPVSYCDQGKHTSQWRRCESPVHFAASGNGAVEACYLKQEGGLR